MNNVSIKPSIRDVWRNDTSVLNRSKQLTISCEVIDFRGNIGKVIGITPGVSQEWHGSIDIKINQPGSGQGYQSGDIETYVWYGWRYNIRIL